VTLHTLVCVARGLMLERAASIGLVVVTACCLVVVAAVDADASTSDLFVANVVITVAAASGGGGAPLNLSADCCNAAVGSFERAVAAVGGEDCAAAAVGAAAAAVAGALHVGVLGTEPESVSFELRYGECPAAAVRRVLEDELRIGRNRNSGCYFAARSEDEQVAYCDLRPGESLAGLRSAYFIADAGGSGEGRWQLSGRPDTVIVCSEFNSSTPLEDISGFVSHYIARLGVTRVFMYDVGAARASVAAARGAVPLDLRGRVTFVRLAGSENAGAVAAFRTCFFSYGAAARWALFAEPHELAQLEPGMTLPEFVSLPRFAARDAIMLRVCGDCGAELDAGECCALGRPLLLFGRVAIAGVRSACTARMDAVVTTAGAQAPLDHAVCGDTAGLPGGQECVQCRRIPHLCRSSDRYGSGGGDVVGIAADAAAPCEVHAKAVVPRATVPSREYRVNVPIQRGWAARPRTRAPRLAYATMAFGDPAPMVLPLLSFMLASARGTGTAADLIVLVPDDGVWTSHAGVAAALAAVGARLWPMPMVDPPEHCLHTLGTDMRRKTVSGSTDGARTTAYFLPTYIQVHVAALAAYDAVAYIDALDVAINGHVDAELAAFAAGHAVWSGRADATPACPAGAIVTAAMQVSRGDLWHIVCVHACVCIFFAHAGGGGSRNCVRVVYTVLRQFASRICAMPLARVSALCLILFVYVIVCAFNILRACNFWSAWCPTAMWAPCCGG
jgi:hypothetical protein